MSNSPDADRIEPQVEKYESPEALSLPSDPFPQERAVREHRTFTVTLLVLRGVFYLTAAAFVALAYSTLIVPEPSTTEVWFKVLTALKEVATFVLGSIFGYWFSRESTRQ